MITNLESKKNRLLQEVEQLNQDRESGKISAEEAKARLEKIHCELREVDEKIADKTQKPLGLHDMCHLPTTAVE